MRTLRLAMAQINATVGDLEGNTQKILAYISKARDLGVDLVAFPELAVTGYPPEDLMLRPEFLRRNLLCMQEIVGASKGLTVVVGFADLQNEVHNAAAIGHDGNLVGIYHKIYLPNYGVFDEKRYFVAGTQSELYAINGVMVGVSICEDIWYEAGPTAVQRKSGAEIVININSSPFHSGKRHLREHMLSNRAAENGLFIAYVNLAGGQDELVFDGASMLFNPRGELVALGHQFEEDLILSDLNIDEVSPSTPQSTTIAKTDPGKRGEVANLEVRHISNSVSAPGSNRPNLSPRVPRVYDGPAEIYRALVLGTSDYVQKTGFPKVLIGMSGGIDSSLTAAIAADALGAERVLGVLMPSRFTTEISVRDAQSVAHNLGIELWTIPIEEPLDAYLQALRMPFGETGFGVAEENLQARIRGNILMAISNKYNWLVLTTGNKSEMATGYATLYGDMAGGFAVLKDVPKTSVYEIASYRNALDDGAVIPENVMTKAPTAELRENQRDEDSLPPYPILDKILRQYVEEDYSYEDLVLEGYNTATIKHIIALVDRNEYKRRQAPPGVKITPRAFGRDRRLPIVNRYRQF